MFPRRERGKEEASRATRRAKAISRLFISSSFTVPTPGGAASSQSKIENQKSKMAAG
jgi:hypothetical protein